MMMMTVCYQDYSKSYRQILMTFLEGRPWGIKQWMSFLADLDPVICYILNIMLNTATVLAYSKYTHFVFSCVYSHMHVTHTGLYPAQKHILSLKKLCTAHTILYSA